MNLRLTALASGLLLVSSVVCLAQVPADSQIETPDFRVVVQGTFDPDTLVEFNKRINAYVALRSKLEEGLPPLVVTDDAGEIDRFERRLADRIRRVRSSRRGQVFAPAMERQVKRMLVLRADEATIAAIMDDAPAEFDIDINHNYHKERPLATMPANLLLTLPDLPPGIEYRFVGRHLILRDSRANIIIDEIPYALQCKDCKPEPEEH
jgi:hypothetical protein